MFYIFRNYFSLSLTLILIWFLSSTTIAQASTSDTAPDYVGKSVTEQQTKPKSKTRQWDWLQLTSGEWLKGDIKVMYNDLLEFDSDELGLLEIDFIDVLQIQTNRNYTVRIIGVDGHLVGVITLTPDFIIIKSDSQELKYERWKLMTLVSGSEKEANYWRVRLGLGINLREGNSPQTEYNGNFNIRRRTVESRLILDYLGTLTRTQEIETANNQRFNGNFDIFSSEKRYYRPILFELYSDPFQNIQTQTTLGAGVGYYLIDTRKTEWDVFLGPGWQSTKFEEVEVGNDIHESSAVLVANTVFETELSKTLDLNADYTIQWVNEASGGYTHHAKIVFENELTGSIDFDVTFIWDFIESPTAGEDGEEPKKNDYRMLLSLNYEFN